LVEQAVIKGDLIVHGGSLILIARSHVLGDLRGEAAEVTIEGEVAGNVDISAWRFTLAPGSVIDGSVRYESRSAASIAESATVSGPITHVDPADRIPFGSLLFWHAAAIPRYLLMLAIGALLVLLAPATMAAISDTPRIDFRPSVVNGLAVVAFGPILLATLGLFIITLPVVLIGGAFLLLAAYLSMAVVGLTFGRIVLSRSAQSHGRASGILGLAIGVTALAVIRALPIPFIDAGVAIVTAITGLGAMLVWAEGGHPLAKLHATRPIASFAIGAVAGSMLVVMAVLAIVAAVTGALAAVATLSRSALFTWEVAPRRLAAAALILAGGALVIGVLALISRSRGRSVITQR
jgi:hypothetical protein